MGKRSRTGLAAVSAPLILLEGVGLGAVLPKELCKTWGTLC